MGGVKLSVEFEALFAAFAPAAVGRLGYLYPKLRFAVRGNTIVVDGSDIDEARLRRDVLYQLYREKIYQDSLPTRELMHRALLS